ncbi:MAG: ANTAR domain-containing protein [Actinomycetota bacterium]|nr:ANTAR domain-containing protein [Actinomycetota bacterium]
MGDSPQLEGLKVLAADEDEQTLAQTNALLSELGHTVTAHAIRIAEAGDLIVTENPDLSVVVVDDDDEHALDLIEEIGEYARGPIIALVAGHDSGFISRAAERGIYAFARPHFHAEVQGAIELAMRRHEESTRLTTQIEQLEGALERRAAIERAKGILMERHGVDDHSAFEMLRQKARGSNRRVVDLARAVADGHALLPKARD